MRRRGGDGDHIAGTVCACKRHDDRMRSEVPKAASARRTGWHKAGCKVGASAAGNIRGRHIVGRKSSSAAAYGIRQARGLLIRKFCRRNLRDGDLARCVETWIADVGDHHRLGRACRELELLGSRNCDKAAQTLRAVGGGNRKRRLWKRRSCKRLLIGEGAGWCRRKNLDHAVERGIVQEEAWLDRVRRCGHWY